MRTMCRPTIYREDDICDVAGTREPRFRVQLGPTPTPNDPTDIPTAQEALIQADAYTATSLFGTELPDGVTLEHDQARYELAAALLRVLLRPREMQRSVDKGLALLVKERGRCAIDGAALTILPGSDRKRTKSYTASDTCTCRDAAFRAHQHGGICKHLAAFYLVVAVNRSTDQELQQALDDLAAEAILFELDGWPDPDELAELAARHSQAADWQHYIRARLAGDTTTPPPACARERLTDPEDEDVEFHDLAPEELEARLFAAAEQGYFDLAAKLATYHPDPDGVRLFLEQMQHMTA
jgi:hypothetical protein